MTCNIIGSRPVSSVLSKVGTVHPCTGRTAHRGSRGIALLIHDHGTRRGWGVSVTLRPLFTPGKDPVPIVQEAGWAPGPVWIGAENLASTGIRSPDRPARSESLYRLRYPAHSVLSRKWNWGGRGLFQRTAIPWRRPWLLSWKTLPWAKPWFCKQDLIGCITTSNIK